MFNLHRGWRGRRTGGIHGVDDVSGGGDEGVGHTTDGDRASDRFRRADSESRLSHKNPLDKAAQKR